MNAEIEHDDSRTALCNQCMKRDDCMPGYTAVDLDYAAKIFEAPARPDECKQYLPYKRYRESNNANPGPNLAQTKKRATQNVT